MTEQTQAPDTSIELTPQMAEMLVKVQNWHTNAKAHLEYLYGKAEPGLKMALDQPVAGCELSYTLTEESSKGFRIAMVLALSSFEKLPFVLIPPAAEGQANAE